MLIDNLKAREFEREFQFSSSRSNGPGGQNVNKVNTKVEIRFNIHLSQLLSDQEKDKLLNNLSKHVLSSGIMVFTSQSFRTQLRNKTNAIEKFYSYIASVLAPIKIRKKSTPTKGSKERRINQKKRLSEIKQRRRKPIL